MTDQNPHDQLPDGRFPCLTELSVSTLVAGALAMSGLLWLAILVVL